MSETIDRDAIESRLRARIHLEVRLFEECRLLEATRRLPIEVIDALAAFTEDLVGTTSVPPRIALVVAEVTRCPSPTLPPSREGQDIRQS